MAPKAAGWNTRVIDHCSREQLVEGYAAINVDTSRIEDVDFVWSGGTLHDTVPSELHGTFDTLIASHVIEHIPDFVSFFVSAGRLVAAKGTIALAVPDKRFCFDYFRPHTTTGEVLGAIGATRHSLNSLFDNMAYSATGNGATAWGQHAISEVRLINSWSDSQRLLAQQQGHKDGPYVDTHGFCFTPASFELLIVELAHIGLIDWRVVHNTGAVGCEFIVHLKRGGESLEGEALAERRTTLATRILIELREQADFVIAGNPGLAAAAATPLDQLRPKREHEYQGFIDERSTLHVQGWVRNLADPAERVDYEIALVRPDGETVLRRDVADQFDADLGAHLGSDGRHAFQCVFAAPLSDADRDTLVVRPAATREPLPLSPRLKTGFEVAVGNDIEWRLLEALRQHRAGNLSAAATGYRSILEDSPKNADAWHLLGLVQHTQGDSLQALTLIEKATQLGNSARYFANLGMVEHYLGHFSEALTACRKALKLDPHHSGAHNTIGVSLIALGDFHSAIRMFENAILIRPSYWQSYMNLGNAYARLGQFSEAEIAYRKAFDFRSPPIEKTERRVLFVYSDSKEPGHVYRCLRMADSARAAGWDAVVALYAELNDEDLQGLAVLIFWRVEMTPRTGRLIALARAGGTRIGLDIDDLIFDPTLAQPQIIDAIRTLGLSPPKVEEYFAAVQKMLLAVDFGVCTTLELAERMRRTGFPVWTIENGFDAATLRASRLARRTRPNDGLLRIGYAAGTKTHQRDMMVAAAAVARVLTESPRSRLVLFRDNSKKENMISVQEMEELLPVLGQIEWREKVPLADLPGEIARFDINIVPLEIGNPFVEAKSELKYFEAALVGVPSIASPTGPFFRAIRSGVNGLLAETNSDWVAGLEALSASPNLRAQIGKEAFRDALRRFGPGVRSVRVDAMLRQIAFERLG